MKNKVSFKDWIMLKRLKVHLFFAEIKLKILGLILGLFLEKKETTISPSNQYEYEKEKFIFYLYSFITAIEIDFPDDFLCDAYENLQKSKFLSYGVQNRELRKYLNELNLPITSEKKEAVLKYLKQKLKEIAPEEAFE